VLRPWIAADGALVRLRLVGGLVSVGQLRTLSRISQRYGDGDLHLTSRANLQARALPDVDGDLRPDVLDAVRRTGLLPAPTHDHIRNVMASPLSGLVGGRVDVRPVAQHLDRLLCASADLTDLPGKFLFTLDDGRGDLASRSTDLGIVALDAVSVQARVGTDGWGPVLALDEAAGWLVATARTFLSARGSGPDAAWHADEIDDAFVPPVTPDPRARVASDPPAYGPHGDHEHVEVPDGVLTPARAAALVAGRGADEPLVVTPWHGVVVRR
jgi:precorrin-3B synthase